MGETTIFECSACGYQSGEVRWGAGSMDARIRFLPALCHTCRDIVEIELTGRDVLVETFSCPACHAPATFFSRGESFRCPRCDAADLKIHQKGYW